MRISRPGALLACWLAAAMSVSLASGAYTKDQRIAGPIASKPDNRIALSRSAINEQQQQRVSYNLQDWPFPLLDKPDSAYRTVYFSPPEHASIGTLQAMAQLAANLGAQDSKGVFTFTDRPEAADVTLMVGTPQENPQIGNLSHEVREKIWSKSQSDVGFLQILEDPEKSGALLIIVSGNTPAGVSKAVHTLETVKTNRQISGATAVIDKPVLEDQPVRCERPNYMPSRPHFALKEVGYKTTSVRGAGYKSVSFELNSHPGLTLMGPPPILHVVFGYSPGLDPAASVMDVTFNGASIVAIPLNKTTGETRRDEDISVPPNLVKAKNKIEVVFHLVRGISTAASLSGLPDESSDSALWGTFYDDTTLTADHECFPQLPDLTLLQHDGYPLVQSASLKDLSIVVPNVIFAGTAEQQQIASGVARLAFQLGRWQKSPGGDLSVFSDDNLPESVRSSSHLILLSTRRNSNLVASRLKDKLHSDRLSFTKKSQGRLSATLPSNPVNDEDSGLGRIEEIISPWASNKVILLMSSETPEQLKYALAGLTEPNILAKLSGNVCSISQKRSVDSTRFGGVKIVSASPPWRYLEALCSMHIWLSPVIVVLFVFWAAFLLKRFLVLKRNIRREAANSL